MKLSVFVCTISLLAGILVSSSIFGAPGVGISSAPDWIIPLKTGGHQPGAKEISDGYYMSLIDIQKHIEKKATYIHLVRDIISSVGVQNGSEVTIYVNPEYEKLAVHQVTLIRDGKPIQKLKPGAFKLIPVEAERDRFLYNGTYAATLVLDDVRKGDRIEYAYTLTGRNPILGESFTDDIYFTAQDPLPHRHHVLISRADRKLAFREFNKPPSMKTSTLGGMTVYEWTIYDLKTPPGEEYEPSWNITSPHVQVSEYTSWKQIVDWALPYYQVPSITPSLQKLVTEWKQKSRNDAARYIQLAVSFVQNEIRYLGMELGEHSHRPHVPDQVLRQRYGDCKDKSLLLCTLLQANGIRAYPALTNTYTGAQTSHFLPDPTAFNHAIVVVYLNNKFVWIDPTIAGQFNQAPHFYIPPYGSALVLNQGETSLRSITPEVRGKVSITETFKLPSPRKTTEPGLLEVVSTYSVNHADDIRSQFAENSVATLEKNYLTFYQDNYRQQQIELGDSIRIDDDTEANQVATYEKYKMANVWEPDSSTGNLSFSVFGRIMYDNLRQLSGAARTQPVAISYPYELDYTLKLLLPETWTASEEKWEIKRDAYEFTCHQSYNEADSTITLHYHFKSLKDHIPVGLVAQYRSDYKRITESLGYSLTFDPSLDSLQGQIHWGGVLVAVLALAGFLWLGVRLYRYSRPTTSTRTEPESIGGWLVLLAIQVSIAPLTVFMQLMKSMEYFDAGTWAAVSQRGGVSWQLFLFVEESMNIGFFCGSVLMVVLFFKRRNTFPYLYTIYLAANAAFMVADGAMAALLTGDQLEYSVIKDIFTSLFWAAIWIPYLNKSQRVKRTFVLPYWQNDQVEKIDTSAELSEPSDLSF